MGKTPQASRRALGRVKTTAKKASMTIEQLKAAVSRRPFQAFSLYMAGGRRIRVRSPEFILVPPGNQRTFVVYEDSVRSDRPAAGGID